MIKELFINLMLNYTASQEYALSCWRELESLYSEEGRYYHTLSHVESMISDLNRCNVEVENHDLLLFAIYYHDAVYDIGASDNEFRSGELFAERVGETSFNMIDKCRKFIESSAGHDACFSSDNALFLDIDLAVLGRSWQEYLLYMENIRREYRIYSDIDYSKGRTILLKTFLKSPIYKTSLFYDLSEVQARENIMREIELLKECCLRINGSSSVSSLLYV